MEAFDEAVNKGNIDEALRWLGSASGLPAQDTVKAYELLRDRAGEPVVVDGISCILSTPIQTRADFYAACAALDGVVSTLPLATLQLYRSGLETLASADTWSPPPGVSPWALKDRAADAVKFIDSPDLAWPPRHKGDGMAMRSLAERVHTAEQMRPHAKELLGWLADVNWPPRRGCIEQLARFPEVAVGPIKELMAEIGDDDAEWIRRLVEFVEEHVPVGELWERLEPELTRLASSEGDGEEEEDRELVETARRVLGVLQEWKKKQVVDERLPLALTE